jgi:hypothetical protein
MELYGYHPPSITSPLKGKAKVQAVKNHIEHRQEVLKQLKENLATTQNRMKQQAYQHHNEREFEWGSGIYEAIAIQTDVPQATKEEQ